MQTQKEILAQMLSATTKCTSIANKITCVNDIKKTIIYDNLISNLLLLKELESKLDVEIKQKHNIINWGKFEEFNKEIISNYYKIKHQTIFRILKEEIPFLHSKLEKIIFS